MVTHKPHLVRVVPVWGPENGPLYVLGGTWQPLQLSGVEPPEICYCVACPCSASNLVPYVLEQQIVQWIHLAATPAS